MDGELVGLGAKQIAAHANDVPKIEQLVKRESFFTDIIQPDVDLQTRARLLQMTKASLALPTQRHQASRHTHAYAMLL